MSRSTKTFVAGPLPEMQLTYNLYKNPISSYHSPTHYIFITKLLQYLLPFSTASILYQLLPTSAHHVCCALVRTKGDAGPRAVAGSAAVLCVSGARGRVPLHQGGGELQPPGNPRPALPWNRTAESRPESYA